MSDSSYMDIPQGSVLAWGAPSFRFGSHPDTGIASNGTNMAFWESGKIALNLADVLREFRVPSDYKFAFSAATNNNAASDTSFYRVQAGVLGTSGKFRVGIGASPSATLLTVSTTEQFRIAYDSFNYWSDTVAADGGRTIAGF